jgi:homoserine acetyltransferase
MSATIGCFLSRRLLKQFSSPTRFPLSSGLASWSYAASTSSHSSSISRRYFSKDGMKDEYGKMTADGDSFIKQDFVLENQEILPVAQLRYQTYGKLNERRDNVLVICHALTGNASLHAWWGDLLGEGKAFDTSKYLVICTNILGSCYGSTNPRSVDPRTGEVYGKTFPDISVKDTVKLQLHLLQEELGASSIKAVIGGSFGGMQAMEFAVQAGSTGGDFVTEDGKRKRDLELRQSKT